MRARLTSFAAVMLASWVLGCHGTKADPVKRKKEGVMENGARCEKKADIEQHDGKGCVVVGTYKQVDLRMRKTPPPVYQGHAAVVLADGTQVLLEPSWSKAGLRDERERAAFDGKPVAVSGVVHLRAPASEDGAAQLTGPCITAVQSVQAP